ncbi:2',3'-cyclic-nucleotide 3'-phosphodiesterase [Diaporthe helianthi]|uniref:2',3'-cyclic-nucleotide 3'-phosphodiesterase n=1 Tax=Diaporthe helianthi TaxID=158607 RepID=A0A2P5HJ65_DIAHE|nr:2',3'-cyclic-nucleotide 3'-phosphodiesterase [Diaporthe helianthi]
MPGSSLWLTPPPSHPLHETITKLIETALPAQFPDASPRPPNFAPHLTLTSGIDPSIYGDEPQKWLDSIPFPTASKVAVRFERVKTQDFFFRKCYLKCEFDGAKDVAAISRARGVEGEDQVGPKTQAWLSEWREAFGPHVSLMYGDMPIDEAKLKEIEDVVKQAGVALGDSSHSMGGWEGGIVWLVSTEKGIENWKPIATRTL